VWVRVSRVLSGCYALWLLRTVVARTKGDMYSAGGELLDLLCKLGRLDNDGLVRRVRRLDLAAAGHYLDNRALDQTAACKPVLDGRIPQTTLLGKEDQLGRLGLQLRKLGRLCACRVACRVGGGCLIVHFHILGGGALNWCLVFDVSHGGCVDTCFAVREGGERCWWVGVGVGVDVS
jgi:hypothetical protein